MLTLKETGDLKDFLMIALTKINEAKAGDGKISAMEAVQLLFASVPAGVAAVQGIQDVKAELKDLSAEETQQLAAWGVEIMAEVAKMFAPVKAA